MTKEELILEATQELAIIKAKATAEEIAKLDWENFNPVQSGECIYGLLTGSFKSKRAKELYPKRYGYNGITSKYEFVDNQVVLYNDGENLTALELYLFYFNDGDGGKLPEHERIFDYLKGVTNEVDLNIK